MKKTLATLLAVALVASLCGVMFVSAESTNLALGKEVANAENIDASISTLWIDTDLTDGKAESGWNILWTAGQWFGYWWNAEAENAYEKANADDGVALPTIDLGAVCTIDKVRVNMFLGNDMGITPAKTVTVKVSNDGVNYEAVATTELAEGEGTTVGWVELALETPVDAQYVCVEMVLSGYWLFIDEIEVYGTAPATEEPDAPAGPEMFWLTHYNDGYVEGSGVIFHEEDTAGGWWIHVAFAPIAGADNAYEIVEITNGLSDGLAAKVAVPEGGFVWASNYGNDYISLGMGDTDFTSPNCTDAINRATAWQVGDQFVISGVDFETIPTTTPDVNWYDDAYVCTATIAPYVPAKTWENTLVIGEDGNASVEVPYGYTWTVNYIDGTIAGEDVTIVTNDDAYAACNPNWAITIYAEKQADGTYVALQDAIVCPGSAAGAGISLGENQIAIVVHSASSNPDGGYANWEGKVVAVSVKAGDVFNVDIDGLTVTALDPNAPVEPEQPEQPDTPVTGDTGILVFAVLAVVAVAGCAVASKIKSSAL